MLGTDCTSCSTWPSLPKCLWRSVAILGFELPRVKFLGTPCEMLYESPLIFIKVKCYYAFKGENLPTSKESVCPSDDSRSCPSPHLPPWAGRSLRLSPSFFVSCIRVIKAISDHLPAPVYPVSSGVGLWEAETVLEAWIPSSWHGF